MIPRLVFFRSEANGAFGNLSARLLEKTLQLSYLERNRVSHAGSTSLREGTSACDASDLRGPRAGTYTGPRPRTSKDPVRLGKFDPSHEAGAGGAAQRLALFTYPATRPSSSVR